MRLMQNEKPIEYHVIDWRNSTFHNHDTSVKRKMLGGVSFGGGVISGSGKRESNITQAGVHETQPSFSHIHEENAFIYAGGSGSVSTKGKAGTKTEAKTKTLNAKESKERNLDVSTGNNILNDIITNVINIAGDNDAEYGSIANNNSAINARAIKSRQFSHMKSITFKLGQGIRTMFGKNTEDTGKQSGQKPKKKLTSGTRPVTKEDVYEIQLNSSYLLDSYNKNGERSTLGKQ